MTEPTEGTHPDPGGKQPARRTDEYSADELAAAAEESDAYQRAVEPDDGHTGDGHA